jgi:nitrate reductase NapD
MTAIDICGVLVQARAERVPEVRERLTRIPGVEVHAATEDGRLVVTVEGSVEHPTLDTISGLIDVPGVAATSLVYQYSDHQEREQESAS